MTFPIGGSCVPVLANNRLGKMGFGEPTPRRRLVGRLFERRRTVVIGSPRSRMLLFWFTQRLWRMKLLKKNEVHQDQNMKMCYWIQIRMEKLISIILEIQSDKKHQNRNILSIAVNITITP
jgi:hypothetical protein